MNKINRELVFLRSFAAITAGAAILLASSAFTRTGIEKFTEINVQRINIVEADGTTRMVITNAGLFPNGKDSINNRATNTARKKRSGMLFFNEDGIECGGFIYDGQKKENGHSSGLSLTYDQYDGDQVMQLITQDFQEGEKRMVSSRLIFNDRPHKETQAGTLAILNELDALKKKDPAAAEKKYQEYLAQGLVGGAPRLMLGKSGSQNNGLFLFDDKGMPRAMFYVDKANNARLDFFDDKGNLVQSFPNPVKK
ncbi:hypothetical protein [Flavihumibacter sp. CACIAM 22H1]|uniref:hypothetical protein n=1 Tax=Flavihumibacter sp. CACIAM 22H1 TaxID=1812911 RepID=UPI0007A86A9B|nr:hypothetical protein [Flavihumibacter sp. CACIAM 22H1]KYP13476.1 MAG: hypothetical protein A1D16_12320 [Flavihumibacter sp. CACIAM 22H1]